MATRMRARDCGIVTGEMPTGPHNRISDVPGVRVGHCTVAGDGLATGATAVLPSPHNLFARRLPAAAVVLNGYGKSTGLMQIEELGTLESPILLTNTLNVGLASDALVGWAIRECAKDGIPLTSFNPVVCECNDSWLNDIRARAVKEAHFLAALQDAREDFEEGDVGAGRGMSCHGLKGGIGSASRVLEMDRRLFRLGVLVLANHGLLRDLTIGGRRIGAEILARGGAAAAEPAEKGSVIVVMGTDLPLSDRQLGRVCRRAAVGLARLGSCLGHGSGDVVVGFSTANPVLPGEPGDILPCSMLREDRLDAAFRAMAEATEEAVLNSMIAADRTAGRDGHVRESLRSYLQGPRAL